MNKKNKKTIIKTYKIKNKKKINNMNKAKCKYKKQSLLKI